ncbi:hypothetical protein SSBR45G_40840 [Bradyrhizobium sp. SSBR45G]|nr:hypothetical protein SSBR45G_40840 [Bradyrhizobium sp. SSBR45G]GLH84610.1 hypothetical protein SSBR45R_20700 [Bradyrhizobium sp. SSBR45R]
MFATDLQSERALAAQLAADFRTEDKTLRFLSAEGYYGEVGYSCGDPKDVRQQRLAAKTKKAVKQENANYSRALANALDTIDHYNDALKKIDKQSADAKAALKFLSSLISQSASIPGFPNYGSVAAAGLPIANTAVDLITIEDLRQLAAEMDAPLQAAVSVIRNNLTELTGETLTAFQLWDECARETLTYLREVPRGGVPGYPTSHIGASSGVELQMAYQAYLTRRASYQSPDLKADLQAILDQNAALMKGGTVSPEALIAALEKATALANKLQATVRVGT